jgi:hypothetical protein
VQWRQFLKQPAAWLGIIGAALTVYGAIAVTELTLRAETGQNFLSTGVPADAARVTFDVGLGKGAPFLRNVQVEFKFADQQSIHTALSWFDSDTPIRATRSARAPSQEPGTQPHSGSFTFQMTPTQQSPWPTPNDSSTTATSTEDGPQVASVSVSLRWEAW